MEGVGRWSPFTVRAGGPREDFARSLFLSSISKRYWFRWTLEKGFLPPMGQPSGRGWVGGRKGIQDVCGGGTDGAWGWVPWGTGGVILPLSAADHEGLGLASDLSGAQVRVRSPSS